MSNSVTIYTIWHRFQPQITRCQRMGVVSKKQARSAQLIGKHYPQLQEPAIGKPQA